MKRYIAHPTGAVLDTLNKRPLDSAERTYAKAKALAAWLNARLAGRAKASDAKGEDVADPGQVSDEPPSAADLSEIQAEIARRVAASLTGADGVRDAGPALVKYVLQSRPGTRATAAAMPGTFAASPKPRACRCPPCCDSYIVPKTGALVGHRACRCPSPFHPAPPCTTGLRDRGRCSCGAPLDWPALPELGRQAIEADDELCRCDKPAGSHTPACPGKPYVLVYKNCPACRTTLCEEVEAGRPPDDPSAKDSGVPAATQARDPALVKRHQKLAQEFERAEERKDYRRADLLLAEMDALESKIEWDEEREEEGHAFPPSVGEQFISAFTSPGSFASRTDQIGNMRSAIEEAGGSSAAYDDDALMALAEELTLAWRERTAKRRKKVAAGVREPKREPGEDRGEDEYPEVRSFDGWRRVFLRLSDRYHREAYAAPRLSAEGLHVRRNYLARQMAAHALAAAIRSAPGLNSVLSPVPEGSSHDRFYFGVVMNEDERLHWGLQTRRHRESRNTLLASGSFSRRFCEALRSVNSKIADEGVNPEASLFSMVRAHNGLFSENPAESDAILYRLNRYVAEVAPDMVREPGKPDKWPGSGDALTPEERAELAKLP